MKYFILILLLSTSAQAEEGLYLNVGLWTEHFIQDCTCFNEDNDVIQITYRNNDGLSLMATKFKTSYYKPAKAFGVGHHFEIYETVVSEVMFGAVEGYKDDLDTHYKGWIFGPFITFKYNYMKVILIGPVINVGFEFPISF